MKHNETLFAIWKHLEPLFFNEKKKCFSFVRRLFFVVFGAIICFALYYMNLLEHLKSIGLDLDGFRDYRLAATFFISLLASLPISLPRWHATEFTLFMSGTFFMALIIVVLIKVNLSVN